jgi:hypothetical protein
MRIRDLAMRAPTTRVALPGTMRQHRMTLRQMEKPNRFNGKVAATGLQGVFSDAVERHQNTLFHSKNTQNTHLWTQRQCRRRQGILGTRFENKSGRSRIMASTS